MYNNLVDCFEHTVHLFSNKMAILDANSKLNFKQLRARAIKLAMAISNNKKSINKPIAIFLPKSNDAIVAFIATLYTGNCYAPLDVKNPMSRIIKILNKLKPVAIITDTKHLDILKSYNLDIKIITCNALPQIPNKPYNFNYKNCIDLDPAYIMHTSGSTGIPKGVAISHRSIIDYINWAIDAFTISENEIIGSQAPFIFDNSTLDIYLMVFKGATLHIIPEQLFVFPAKLLEFLETHKVNFVFWVPSVLIYIANLKLLSIYKIPSLKKVLFAGEVMPTKHLNYWIGNLNKDILYANLYGPTEITVDCTYYIINRPFKDNQPLPIGKPCRNSDVFLLNNNDELCKTNEQGEICVRGSSLALGYWNDIKKTKAVFVQNPLNNSYPEKIYRTGDLAFINTMGDIIFSGRKDNQIKHLGYRIELGEIEHSILSIFESIIVRAIYDGQNREIVLFYESKTEIPIRLFRQKLAKVLSGYMIPAKYYKVDTMPLSLNGKIDLAALQKQFISKKKSLEMAK
ncbi:amino acid adenylation domain-containing protein [uncultured Winogradskyella sp.]|uniref:amino acid adenylation domain-containing protein n=1 Tax=uncultured Winogradskyella sp. TaxID=395353 RepID=UPI0030D8AB0E